MEKNLNIFQSIEALSQFVGRMLTEQISCKSEGNFFSLVLSGGSTPKKVFEFLAANFKEQIAWERILVFWGDERCVPPESDESNYNMAKESLLDLVPIPSANIFRIQGEADPADEAERYAKLVSEKVALVNGIPQFDFVMLGLGDDGHTASIFPDNLQLFKCNKHFAVVENPYSKQKRITVIGNIINQANTVIFLVTGQSKAEMVARLIEKKEGWERLPASQVQPNNGNLRWLLDMGASSKLNQTV